jgi:solute carrier family 25 protein 33/36
MEKRVVPPSAWVSSFAGGTAGAIGTIITCPLEVLKTRYQARTHTGNGHSPLTAMRQIAKTEGIRGLWRGLMPTLVGTVPSRAIYFNVYSFCKHELSKCSSEENPLVHFSSAGIAGVISTTITNPIWMIKTRLQLEKETHSGVVKTTLNVVKNEGVMSLWKGVSASYLGVFETCAQWVLYEKMKTAYSHKFQVTKQDIDPKILLSFGSVSKIVAAISWYPHEVIRTRLREIDAPYKGLVDCFASIVRNEGFLNLYSGLGIHLLRVVPNSAITIISFELIMRAFYH